MTQDVREQVRETYARAAQAVGGGSCCSCGPLSCTDPITSNLYDADQLGSIPEKAAKASLGCGNPTSRAGLKPGQVVLDLGSGGGIDVPPCSTCAPRVGTSARRGSEWRSSTVCSSRWRPSWPRCTGSTTWPTRD